LELTGVIVSLRSTQELKTIVLCLSTEAKRLQHTTQAIVFNS